MILKTSSLSRKLNLTLLSVFLLLSALINSGSSSMAHSPGDINRPDIYEPAVVEVKFKEGFNIRLRGGVLIDSGTGPQNAPELAEFINLVPGGQWQRGHSVSEEILENLHAAGNTRNGNQLPDLNLYYRVALPPGFTAERAVTIFNQHPLVENAYLVPRPATNTVFVPNYQDSGPPRYQRYLDAAPDGINARYGWNSIGTEGSDVRICDVEYNYNAAHIDLPPINFLGANLSDPFNDTNHGTAVLGILASLNDGFGTTGIAWNSQLYFAAAQTQGYGYNVARAIMECAAALESGDIILIEQQTFGPNYVGAGQQGLVPVEWYRPTYDAIVTATANGIIVVETAGNGGENLDDAVYSTGNNGHYPFLLENDSGAILVGAGASAYNETPRARLSFSNYGATLDLQGWGQDVVTTGFGNLFSDGGTDYHYTNSFNGTSSAGPIVAGAVAQFVEFHKSMFGTPAPAAVVRDILRITGTPQSGSDQIGPLPDLKAAMDYVITAPSTWIFVDQNATGANDGSSWANAYIELQDAFYKAKPGDTILVAEGAYWPDWDPVNKTVTGDREDTFQLKNGVAIYGGYAAGGGKRNPETNETFLSGNIGPDEAWSCHIVTGSGTNGSAVLDGFKIMGGRALNGCANGNGAGIFINNGSPTLQNLIIMDNLAANGGGMFLANAGPRMYNVIFDTNAADYGGGMYNSYSTPNVAEVTFIDNAAALVSSIGEGGGVFNLGGKPQFFNARFLNNTAYRGGAMANWGLSDVGVFNAVFSGNTSESVGSAINHWQSDLTLNHVAISGNTSNSNGQPIYIFTPEVSLTMNNSIVWGNTNGTIGTNGPNAVVFNSIIQGGYPGTLVLNDDPLFSDPDGLDNLLGTLDDNLSLMVGSPAINTGKPSVCEEGDLLGKTRLGVCDLGAYEFSTPMFLPLLLSNAQIDIQNPVPNHDFEQGQTAWRETSSNGYNVVVEPQHNNPGPLSGTWLAWLGGANNEVSTLSQRLKVPAESPFLTYYAWFSTFETTCGVDTAQVLINNTPVENWDMCLDRTDNNQWVFRTLDLRDFIGQTIEITFKISTDATSGNDWSNFFLEDVVFRPTTN